jgi:hypothetical protein
MFPDLARRLLGRVDSGYNGSGHRAGATAIGVNRQRGQPPKRLIHRESPALLRPRASWGVTATSLLARNSQPGRELSLLL